MNERSLRAIARKYRLDAVVLFGSRARGDAKPGSDFDVCVSAPRLRGNEAELAGDLIETLGEDVDLCLLERIGPSLLLSVALEGKLLWGRRDRFDRMRLSALRQWQDSRKYVEAVSAYLDRNAG
ncbi:MAG: nucleotidyltransferase domain-containing protein [Planctomycetes bacterium]|nr:nucleotidyltransferase domain-containing protein [Planctomycetota bacterium]